MALATKGELFLMGKAALDTTNDRTSRRMFPTWSELHEALFGEEDQKPSCKRVTTENHALLVWSYGRAEHSCPAMLKEIGPTRARLASLGLVAPGTPARFCLIEPFASRWVEASVIATKRRENGPHQIELSVTHRRGWEEILQALGSGADQVLLRHPVLRQCPLRG